MDANPDWHGVRLSLAYDEDVADDAASIARTANHLVRPYGRTAEPSARWQALPVHRGTAFTEPDFAADITATQRDDGEVWLDFTDDASLPAVGERFRAEYATRRRGFPAPVWHGTARFTLTTTTGLWRVSLGSGSRPFNLIVHPPLHDIHGEPVGRGPEKVCRSCQTSRSVAFFTRNPRNPDGLQRDCVMCSAVPRSKNRRGRATASSRNRKAALVRVPDGFKACSVCASAKPATTQFFGPDRRTRDGLQHRCRRCSGTVPALMARIEATIGIC